MPGTCLARSVPLSTGHRLHRGRSRSVHAGKWSPYALAPLPPSTLCRHPAGRKHNHLCSPSTVGSSPSRLSALTPCFLLQSTLKSLVDLKELLSLPGTFLCHSGAGCFLKCHELIVPLVLHVSRLIIWRSLGQGGKPSVCMCRQVVHNWCFVQRRRDAALNVISSRLSVEQLTTDELFL